VISVKLRHILKKRQQYCGIFAALVSTLGFVSVVQARVPDDTFYGRQWYLHQINAEQAWDKTVGSSSVIVAVIDTGFDIDHEDLKDNIWTNPKEIPGNGIDDDRNGYVDDVHGWNFVTDSNNVRPRDMGTGGDLYIHGTLVASLIGARGNNGIGITGVAWNVKIMPLTALDDMGEGSTERVADAIRYAVLNGAHLINLSLEGYTRTQDVEDALAFARSRGVLTMAAAGNSEFPDGEDLDVVRVYPVCLSQDQQFGVVGVGGTDTLDQKAEYANYGSCVDLSAPASDLFGARPMSSATTTQPGYEGGYSGTSLAAPLVTGVAALIKSVHPEWTASQIRERLLQSVTPIDGVLPEALRGKMGRGRLDAAMALEDATSTVILSESVEVQASVPGRVTRVRIKRGTSVVEIKPFGGKDTRGARAAITDVYRDGNQQVVAVVASGQRADWVLYNPGGTEIRRGIVSTNVRGTLVVAAASGGFVIAETAGGRAWGVDWAGNVFPFTPFGPSYRAGLDLVGVADAAAFSPIGGGGHLMVTDIHGKRLVSDFPFGRDARGRWTLSYLPPSPSRPASLVMSGPPGMHVIDAQRLGTSAWEVISAQELKQSFSLKSSGSVTSDKEFLMFDQRSR
jgi:subtilisin family serine protease